MAAEERAAHDVVELGDTAEKEEAEALRPGGEEAVEISMATTRRGKGVGKSTSTCAREREPEVWRVPLTAAAAAVVFSKPSHKAPNLGTRAAGSYVNVSFLRGDWLRLHKAEGYGQQPGWMQAQELEKQQVRVWRVVWDQEVPVREEPSRLALEIAFKVPGSRVRVAYREGDWLRLHWQRPAWIMAQGLLGAMLEEERGEAAAAEERGEAAAAEERGEAAAAEERGEAAAAEERGEAAAAEAGEEPAQEHREATGVRAGEEPEQEHAGEAAAEGQPAPPSEGQLAVAQKACAPVERDSVPVVPDIAGGFTVRQAALTELLARDVQGHLASLPPDAWSLLESKDQPLITGARPVPMRFHRLEQDLEVLTAQVMSPLAKALCLRPPHERLFVNFSKYQQGDFLGTHSDVPTGNPSYRRRLAFVWYLTDQWEASFGGALVDEDAEGGPQPLTPSFNTLVSFPVPRRHSVSEVTADGRARLAAYGWAVEPRLESLCSAEEVQALLKSLGRRALALAFVKDPAVLEAFTGLPLEPLGHHHYLGELVVFATTLDAGAASVLGVPPEGVAVVAGGSCRVCADVELLRQPAELRRFVNATRKVYSPCAELDCTDSLLMAELCCARELKVFVFGVSSALRVRLDGWAAALQPALRVLVAEPSKNRRVLEDFGLEEGDLPTAVAEDTVGKLGTFRLKEHGGRGLEQLRSWLSMLARAVGMSQPELS